MINYYYANLKILYCFYELVKTVSDVAMSLLPGSKLFKGMDYLAKGKTFEKTQETYGGLNKRIKAAKDRFFTKPQRGQGESGGSDEVNVNMVVLPN
ncbi:hypothetical protein [Hydrogenimonas thermophila]|uniref:Uncharacterized protein n=1 Tax=Hydrogenimonas thermophila TaxID=223786 RepID=A0A1I5P3Y9_9BACT|nr:hypothetical protein [Hydrogenimonas thermophila]SFP28814.1 hypothetical protein SAMN05216234_11344 [Hydrogenimonas thermophila]